MVLLASERGPNRPRPTTTLTETSSGSRLSGAGNPSATLRLRAVSTQTRHIQWAEDVVDNEGMGKKSSKVCCIYHRPREVGESSDEDSSDSSSSDESDSEPDTSRAQPRGHGLGRQHQHRHHDDNMSYHRSSPTQDGRGEGANLKAQEKSKRPSPNAYERMPKSATHKPNTS